MILIIHIVILIKRILCIDRKDEIYEEYTIGEVLKEYGYINDEQLNVALEAQKSNRSKRLGQHLIDLGFVSEYQMLEALSDKLAEPLIELSEIKVDIDAVQKIPRAMADKYNIIAIDLTDQQLTIVTSDPLNFYGIEDVRLVTGMHLNVCLATKAEVSKAIDRYYNDVAALDIADDIKLNLAAADIRIEAPIPGKSAIGIEVPNKTNQMVMFRELIENQEFAQARSKIAFAVGKNLAGQVIVSDIAKMPHLLIAGATGSGKSVCINTLIMSILYKATPDEVKLIMIDPKVVELSAYQGIPHLLIPVVTDPKQASSALNWAVMEMGERYKKFAEVNVRNLTGYNEKVEESIKNGMEGEDFKKLPQIVIIVDELADLMMVAPGEVEDAIVRLSQLARAAGIHLVIATQRPSVNVITGLIKANVPSRIAFSVSIRSRFKNNYRYEWCRKVIRKR